MLRFESNAVLWFSCHTVPTVPDFFIALFQASDVTAIIQSGLSSWVISLLRLFLLLPIGA
jgi:hypothetical protein